MARIQRFEDIEAWKRGRELSRRVYAVTASGAFAKDFELRGQIRKAAISIISNIAEGFERDGTKEFCQFLAQAKGSAGEVRAQLYAALDVGYIDQATFDELSGLAAEIGAMLRGFIRYLQATDIRGHKYSPVPHSET